MNNSGVLRMAVVGCGYFGEKHADIIGQLSNAELVAEDVRVEKVILPLRDGLTIIRKK